MLLISCVEFVYSLVGDENHVGGLKGSFFTRWMKNTAWKKAFIVISDGIQTYLLKLTI